MLNRNAYDFDVFDDEVTLACQSMSLEEFTNFIQRLSDEDLLSIRNRLNDEIAAIKAQIEAKKLEYAPGAQLSRDLYNWKTRANLARRMKNQKKEVLTRELNDRRRDRHAAKTVGFEENSSRKKKVAAYWEIISFLRMQVDAETFQTIVFQVNEKHDTNFQPVNFTIKSSN